MNHNPFKHLSILASAFITLGCATSSNLKNTETMAAAAGFKVIKPTKPDQVKALEKLPTDKFTRITHAGKTYYIFPDRADGQAYIGGQKQYQDFIEDGQARAAVGDYNAATSSNASEAGTTVDYGDLNTWEGWEETKDGSATDGQTG
jgi:hypothetical protein